MFPESLFTLSQRDLQGTWLDPVVRNVIAGLAATTVQAQFQLPVDRATLLTVMDVQATPGAGQTVQRLQLRLFPRGSLTVGVRVAGKVSSAGVAVRDELFATFPELLVPPGWIIEGSAIFDLGGVANTVDFNFAGVHIPAGNIQRL